jgi:aconitate hydratase
LDSIAKCYEKTRVSIPAARELLGRPLTYAEKVLYSHLYSPTISAYERGVDYVELKPDRVAMQDATAQMAVLQFMNAGKPESVVPATVHCDHLIQAYQGAMKDLAIANVTNKEVYDFLKSACDKYGLGFWEPGAGIIHQVVLENYAFPGGMMVGTDSHTPNAGGLAMAAIGVGGADAVDVMTGLPWELKMPKVIGVKLTGELSGWGSPKDVILKLAGILTVKGGTNAIIEYFGPGTETLSATGKGSICNMGAEVGATCSIFPYDAQIAEYLKATDRANVAELADSMAEFLRPDPEVEAEPEKYYDQLIEIDLSALEPQLNGPFTPDAATPLSQFAAKAKDAGWPLKMEIGLIGSCTNSSYEDLTRIASLAQQLRDKHITMASPVYLNPGSEAIKETSDRDGMTELFESTGTTLMANACGPCIGQWRRDPEGDERPNSIVTSFNRNFAGRNDGNPNTHAFVASPELTMVLAAAGRLDFNPNTDTLVNDEGDEVKLEPPTGTTLPASGFTGRLKGFHAPTFATAQVSIAPDSKRLQKLEPFPAWDGEDLRDMPLLVKVAGKCTTDHISKAGPWLRFRGHLENISDNLLLGGQNAFTGETGKTINQLTGETDDIPKVGKAYRAAGVSSVIVAEENYGEGSSREHAAMEPRFVGVKAVLVKSFARIHETNLKKQGVLALTFQNPDDYALIRPNDRISVLGLKDFAPGVPLRVRLTHEDGTSDEFAAAHSYNDQQIKWFGAGSALNYSAKEAA